MSVRDPSAAMPRSGSRLTAAASSSRVRTSTRTESPNSFGSAASIRWIARSGVSPDVYTTLPLIKTVLASA